MPPLSLLLLSISSTIAPITSVLVFPLHLPLLSHLLQACPNSTYFSPPHYRCYSTRAHTSPTSPPLFYPLSDTLSHPLFPLSISVPILPLPLSPTLLPILHVCPTPPTSSLTIVPTIPPITCEPYSPYFFPHYCPYYPPNYRRVPITQSDSLKTRQISFFARTTI